ncbi:MAG: hypothetical protein [Siphoviridae sp. ct7UA22]|nr:MAG: hypothetical protein [Siphoviridae sp. ct7UA22]
MDQLQQQMALAQLAQMLTANPQNKAGIANLHGNLAAQDVPLDHPTMLQATGQPAQPQATPQALLDLQQALALDGNPQSPLVQQMYQRAAISGEIPLDDPTMLMANPQLAQTLAAQTARPQAQNINLDFRPQFPDMQYEQPKPFFERFGENLRGAGSGIADVAGETKSAFDNLMRDTAGAFLYGLMGPAHVPTPTTRPQQAAPAPAQQAPAPVQQAPVQTAPVQAAPVARQAAPQVNPQLAAELAAVANEQPMAQPVAQQAASPTDIAAALTGTPAQPKAEMGVWDKLTSPAMLTYLQDALAGVAMNPNWAQGMTEGVLRNEQRGVTAAEREMQRILAQSKLDLNQSEINKNQAGATKDMVEAKNKASGQEDAKTQAEINKLNAEARLAAMRAQYAGQESAAKPYSDANYINDYTMQYKTLSELEALNPSEDPWSADFRARESLNKVGGQVTRYIPVNAETDRVLREAQLAVNEAQTPEERQAAARELASRIQRATIVHGPEAVQRYRPQSQ